MSILSSFLLTFSSNTGTWPKQFLFWSLSLSSLILSFPRYLPLNNEIFKIWKLGQNGWHISILLFCYLYVLWAHFKNFFKNLEKAVVIQTFTNYWKKNRIRTCKPFCPNIDRLPATAFKILKISIINGKYLKIDKITSNS